MMWELLNKDPQYIGDYHLWLAHDVLKDPEQWRRLSQAIRMYYPEATIIMDNSLIELGAPISGENLKLSSLAVGADYLVLPDVLTDMDATLDGSRDFLARMGSDLDIKTLGVIQGKSIGELHRCASALVGMGCSALSIPRIVQKQFGDRKGIVREIAGAFPHIKIHLLGFSDNLEADREACRTSRHFPNVMGIDSAVPIRVGQKNELLYGYTAMKVGSRAEDYLERSDPPTPYTLVNLREFRRSIQCDA
jgi:hypothetical protein